MAIRAIARLRAELFHVFQQIVGLLPDQGLTVRLRRAFYGCYLRKAGSFSSCSGLKIHGPENVSIGDGVSMNTGVIIDAADGGDIQIGNDVLIGPYCVIRAADHIFSDTAVPIRQQGHAGGKIVIEDDCWLGSHVVVTRDVTIGKGSVIGAHSVVTHDIPPYSIAVGVPAKVQRNRRD